MTPGQILESTLPSNRRERARAIIGIALAATMLVVWAIVWAMLFGWPIVGQVAWASDVDKKIEKAVGPLKDEISELKQAVERNNQVSNSLLASVTASQIRATFARLCKETSDAERARLNADYDRYLTEYPEYTKGRPFPVESLRCGQL